MEHWSAAAAAAAAALYILSRITGRDVEFLKSATRVHQLKDLAKLLETESTVLPSIIAVSGRVGSETPIKSEHSGILSVIVEKMAEKHFLRRNWKFSWVKDCALMLPMSKEVPWYLEDGTGRGNVAGAQGAIGFTLTFGSEVFEKSEPISLIRGTLDYLRGRKMLGIKRIERVLPIGTQLTVVGQAIKDGTGDVRIQKPEEGSFYITPIPLDQLITSLGKWSRMLKNASMGLALLSAILISKPLIEYILVRTGNILVRTGYIIKRRLELFLRNRVVDAAANREERRRIQGLQRQRENMSNGRSRNGDAAADIEERRMIEGLQRQRENRAVDRSRNGNAAANREERRMIEGLQRQRENMSNGDAAANREERRSRVVDAAANRVERRSRVADAAANREERRSRVVDAAANREERRSRVVDAAANREEQRMIEGLQRQRENMSVGSSNGDGPDLCVICLDQKYNVAFIPCGHVCCCMTCSSRLQRNTCPLCRKPVSDTLKIYRH